MTDATIDLLYLIAEVSIATVALSGITMVLAVTNLSLTIERASLIGVQLRMAFVVTAFAIFPLLLIHFGLSGAKLWLWASIGYLLAVGFNILWSLVTPARLSKLPKIARFMVAVTAATAIFLLCVNIWLTTSWPYVTQLCFGWASSTFLFLNFIHEVLISETGSE